VAVARTHFTQADYRYINVGMLASAVVTVAPCCLVIPTSNEGPPIRRLGARPVNARSLV
jgi:hypothetical protein